MSMNKDGYTCKVIFHTIKDSLKVKHIQLFRSLETANQWASIQEVRGFIPVSVEPDVSIDAGMVHINGQVHQGHYIQVS